jgi:hypothetical protein
MTTTMTMTTTIEAALRYCIDTGVKPVTETTGPGGRLRRRSGGHDDLRTVEIHDARPRVGALSIEVEGFELVRAPTAVDDPWDEDQLREVYYPETEALIARVAGASRVVTFDHTLRSGDPARHEGSFAREPVQVVHNDYTERSGPWRVHDVLPDEAEDLLARRVAIIQVWRPIARPALAYPLALCDARSVSPAQFVPTERRHPNRVGEIYQLTHDPAHRWSYFPAMEPDEAIVFKVYDSATDGRARFTPHTSFEHPRTPTGAIRESVELRCLALF